MNRLETDTHVLRSCLTGVNDGAYCFGTEEEEDWGEKGGGGGGGGERERRAHTHTHTHTHTTHTHTQSPEDYVLYQLNFFFFLKVFTTAF